jgi:hypothetical protein
MKKVTLSILLLAGLAGPTLAQNLSVVIDGKPVTFDQPPVMSGGRVLVPLRGIFERLGADVHYDAATRHIQATKGQTVVELTLGSQNAVVSGRAVTLDTPASTIGGRTVVPLRFVSESLGADVRWEAASRTISISSGQPGPPVAQNPPPPVPQQQERIRVSPRPDATVTGARPRVSADFPDPIRPETLRFRFDEQDLTGAVQRTPDGFQWIPGRELADGTHQVMVEALALNGQPLRRRWHFDVVSGQGLIRGVEFGPPGPLTGGQILHITVQGAPHGQCTVDIGGRRGLHLDETSPGVYQTGYTVANEDHGDYPMVAHLALPDGRVDTRTADHHVLMNPPQAPPPPMAYILELRRPSQGERVPPNFVVQGRSFPFAHIELKVHSRKSLIPGVVGVEGPEERLSANADGNGFFTIPVNASETPPGSAMTLNLRAFNDQGRVAPPIVLQVFRQ